MRQFVLALVVVCSIAPARAGQAQDGNAPPGTMSVGEARGLIKRLATYVVEHHLKRDEKSAQNGLIYEYLDVTRMGQPTQFVEGEALDTMHDGAWFAVAMASAFRATIDDFYRQVLVRHQLPFYCKMLNHSDELFSAGQNDARPGTRFGKEWMLVEGEKGFVPYFWDDGNSVSLDRRRDHNPLGIAPCRDFLAGKPNPDGVLNGYSLGSSNHLAQDLGVMLQQSWLLLRESGDATDKAEAAEVAEAAKNLLACRMRHHGHIPMCDAPAALVSADAKLMRGVPDPAAETNWVPANHYVRALYDFTPGQRMPFPGFADDQEYHYYYGIARAGGKLPKPLAFKVIYDAFTEPLLYRYYCDDAPVEPGVNIFDLHPYAALDGKPVDYRSDRKGPRNQPKPTGSRMGPQSMVCCGWALQALRAYPGIWEEPYLRKFKDDVRVRIDDAPRVKDVAVPYAEAFAGDVGLSVVSSHAALEGVGRFNGAERKIDVFSRPDGKGSHASIILRGDGAVTATNGAGETLVIEGSVRPDDHGSAFSFRIPYTAMKGQRGWANGVEHERLSIRIDGRIRNLYLASSEADVRAGLERELGAGLRTWDGIFRKAGYVPSGFGTGQDFDHFSDTGGYAHLISAAAEWIFYQEGTSDWELQRVPDLK